MFESKGKLHYSIGQYHKLIVEIDPEIVRYYRSLIPKYIQTNSQMYPAHISVVRHEIVTNLQYWNKYEGEEIHFQYEGYVFNDNVYYWINCFSKRLEEIRVELGLPLLKKTESSFLQFVKRLLFVLLGKSITPRIYTKPPEGYKKVFHCSIGNSKKLGKLK